MTNEQLATNNFLIVCGGTGRGIFKSHEALGFDGVMQIDVKTDTVAINGDTVFSVQLPLPRTDHNGLTNVHVMNEFHASLLDKLNETAQSISELTKKKNELEQEFRILMDRNDDADFAVRRTMEQEITVVTDTISKQKNTYQMLDKRVNHILRAISAATPSVVNEGMSQSPAIGRSYVELQPVSDAVYVALSKMLGKRDRNIPQVTFWVVASMCGGTGQGIYMHVIDLIHKLHGVNRDIALQVKVVRIGSLSYHSVSPQIKLNAMWSLMTDYGFIHQHTLANRAGDINSQLNYYYLDLEDVGSGDVAKPKREDVVVAAFKAITQQQLNKNFGTIFSNIRVAPKVVMARIGEWSHELEMQSKYTETLKELANKLEILLWPKPTDLISVTYKVSTVYGEKNPSEVCADVNLNQAISMDHVKHIADFSPKTTNYTKETLDSYTGTDEWKTYERFVHSVLGKSTFDALFRSTRLDLVSSVASQTQSLKFDTVANEKKYSAEYINKIKLAQNAIARIEIELTGTDVTSRLVDLCEKWKKMKKGGFFVDDKVKIEAVVSGFESFLEVFVAVKKMLSERALAKGVVSGAISDNQKLVTTINKQVEKSSSDGEVFTVCAELETLFGRKTWLELLNDSVASNIEVALENGQFRKAVERGAQGLTEAGFKKVLGISADYTVSNIVDVLNNSIGDRQSYWWQGIVPDMTANNGDYHFRYRLLPQLPPKFMQSLFEENASRASTSTVPEYIVSEDNRYGLKVYGVECIAAGEVSIQQQFTSLISPLLGSYLKNNSYFNGADYLATNCLCFAGTPVYFPKEVQRSDTGMLALREFLTKEMANIVNVLSEA